MRKSAGQESPLTVNKPGVMYGQFHTSHRILRVKRLRWEKVLFIFFGEI